MAKPIPKTETYPRIGRQAGGWIVYIDEYRSKMFKADEKEKARQLYTAELDFLMLQHWYLYQMKPICHN